MSSPYQPPHGAHGRDVPYSPISQLGRVTVNSQIDADAIKIARQAPQERLLYKNAHNRDEKMFTINKYELLLMRNGKTVEKESGKYIGKLPLVISNLNSITTSDALTEDEIIENYSYVGQAQTTVQVDKHHPEGPEIATEIGGLNSLMNSDMEPWYAGDLLYWDPVKRTANGHADTSTYTQVPVYAPEGRVPIVARRFTWAKAAVHGRNTLRKFIAPRAQGQAAPRPTMHNGGKYLENLDKLIERIVRGAQDAQTPAQAQESAKAALRALINSNGNDDSALIHSLLESSCTLHKSVTSRIICKTVNNAAPKTFVDKIPANYIM